MLVLVYYFYNKNFLIKILTEDGFNVTDINIYSRSYNFWNMFGGYFEKKIKNMDIQLIDKQELINYLVTKTRNVEECCM